MDRRTLLKRIALVASATYWSGETLAMELAKAATARDEGQAAAVEALPAARRATLAAVCGLIIPLTDTPGALEAGVPAFIEDMYAHWMLAAERASLLAGLAELDAAATKAHGADFAAATGAQQAALLGAARAAAAGYQSRGFGARLADPGAPFFFKMRDLVTLGYFTSEVGVSAELAYVPVPGRWDADIPINTWNKQIQL